jgi:WxL Interacting Protein, peptidoglycan binding domain
VSPVRPATLAVAFLAAMAVPAAAGAASAIGPGQFGLAPSTSAGGQPRAYFNLQLEPGQTATDSVIVSNRSRAREKLRLTISRGVTAANSGSAFEPARRHCAGSGCWVSGLPSAVTLAPRASRAVVFRVHVPGRTRPGQYLSGITAQVAAARRVVRVGGPHSSARAVIIDQVTVGVAVTVGRPGRLRTAVAVRQVTGSWIGRVARLTIGVSNRGQTFAQASGHVACRPGGRRHSYPVTMNTVLPGGRAALAVNAPGLAAGQIPCTVRLRDDVGHLVTWSGVVRLRAAALTRTVETANGVFTSVPQNTVPPWAIALMVLGALVVALLLAVLLRSRRAKRPATQLPRRHRRPA